MSRWLYVLISASLCAMAVPSFAVIYVQPGGAGLQDGSSWSNAFGSIQQAINAGPTVEIWVAAGVYTEPAPITWKSNVAVYGGFTVGMSSLTQRDYALHLTILDGQNARRITTISNVSNIRLDGFMLQNGNGADPAVYNGWGGAMFTEVDQSCVVANCTFRNNSCTVHGGALSINFLPGTPSLPGVGCTLENCLFENNTSANGGGGVFVHWCTANVNNCTFTGNVAQNWIGGGIVFWGSAGSSANCTLTGNQATEGAGMHLDVGATVAISGYTVSGNTAASNGGGVYIHDSSPSFTDCDVFNNTLNAAGGQGGGIRAQSSSPTFTNCSIYGNTGGAGGGVFCGSFNNTYNYVFTGCQINDNVATSEAGGLFFEVHTNGTGNLVMSDCVISGNQALYTAGGAFFRAANTLAWGGTENAPGHASIEISDTLFSGNIASRYSGGGAYIEAYAHDGYGATMDAALTRCTFDGNQGQGMIGGSSSTEPSSNGAGLSWIRSGGSITDCTFINNVTTNVAGGLWVENCSGGPSLLVSGCLFQGNQANVHGGAIWNAGYANTTIQSTRFVQNTAASAGGGVFNISRSTMNLVNCIFDRNNAVTWMGGALATWDQSSTGIMNCTFSGNTCGVSASERSTLRNGYGAEDPSSMSIVNAISFGNNLPEVHAPAPAVSVSYSNFQGTYAPGPNTVGNPNFINAAAGDLRIGAGSAAENAGTATSAPAVDIIGTPRPQGAGYDMGAYERDGTPPTLTIGAPSLSATNTGPVSFSVTYTGASTVTLVPENIGLTGAGASASTIEVAGTGATSRTVTLRGITGNGTLGIAIAAGTAADLAGNLEANGGTSATFTVDNTPPSIAVSNPSPTLTRTGPVSYTVTYTGAANITLDEGDVTLAAPPGGTGTITLGGSGSSRAVTVSSLAGDGNYYIAIAAGTAVDSLGNAASAIGSNTFLVDTTPPNPPANLTGVTPTMNQRPTWTWSPGGGGNGIYRHQLDASGTWTNTNNTYYTPGFDLSNGTHRLVVQARDAAGNWSGDSFFDIVVDLTPPTAPNVTGVTPTNSVRPTWTWTPGGGGNGTYRYELDSTAGAWTSTTQLAFTPVADLAAGTHRLYVQERDAVGNWSSSGFFDILIDLTPPNPPTVTGTTPTNDQTPTWTWNPGGGGNGTFRWELDDSGTWTEIAGYSYTPGAALTAGTHRLAVQERDAAGNWSPEGVFDILIDIAPPGAPSVTGPALTNNPRPTWTWTSGGGGNGAYRCQLDGVGGAWLAAADASFTPAVDLAEGSRRLYVQERDAAGNWSASGFFDIFVDVTPPAKVTILGTTPTNNPRPTWTWTPGGGGNGMFRWELDASGIWTATTGFSYTPTANLAEGTHRINVQERDQAGNWSEDSFFDIVVDGTPPMAPAQGVPITRNLDPSGVYNLSAADIQAMAAEAYDEGGIDWAATAASADITAFDCGDLAAPAGVSFRVYDLLGNGALNDTTALITLRDTTPPAAQCKNIGVSLDVDGLASLAAEDVDAGSNDECGTVTLAVAPDAFTCEDLGLNNVVLTVRDAQGNEATCQATVLVDDPLRACSTLAVNATGDLEIHKFIGGQHTFSVTVLDAQGPLEYHWQFQEDAGKTFVPLLDGGAISGAETQTLTIRPIAAAHTGQYRCVVYDGFNNAESPIFTLYVEEGLPVGGLLVLLALTGMIGAGGAMALRRKP